MLSWTWTRISSTWKNLLIFQIITRTINNRLENVFLISYMLETTLFLWKIDETFIDTRRSLSWRNIANVVSSESHYKVCARNLHRCGHLVISLDTFILSCSTRHTRPTWFYHVSHSWMLLHARQERSRSPFWMHYSEKLTHANLRSLLLTTCMSEWDFSVEYFSRGKLNFHFASVWQMWRLWRHDFFLFLKRILLTGNNCILII